MFSYVCLHVRQGLLRIVRSAQRDAQVRLCWILTVKANVYRYSFDTYKSDGYNDCEFE